MTRRSFLKNIAGALAVLALPAAVRAGAEERVAKEQAMLDVMAPEFPRRFEFLDGEFHEIQTGREGLNLAWLNATYEEVFIVHRDLVRIFL